MLHKTVATKRYKKIGTDKAGNAVKGHFKVVNGKREATTKYREIFYANHLDAHVYSYYTQKELEPRYEAELEKNGLQYSILAYRRIEVTGEERCKCNIDFANDAFNEIKSYPGRAAVLALDISKFFDSLDHGLLKRAWTRVLGRIDLPKDHYNLYKNITRFDYVELPDILKEFGYKHANELIQDEVSYLVRNGKEFRSRIKEKGYLKHNPFRAAEGDGKKVMVGIPQGTPISALLANLYLLEFDKGVHDLLQPYHAIYKRYSDDILIICPEGSNAYIEEEIYRLIKKFKLVIQPEKTQRSIFVDGKLCKGEKPVTYLGFQFDGRQKLLKPASLSKFYRKMKSAVKYRAYRAKTVRKKEIRAKRSLDTSIHRKLLYDQYSFLGAGNDNRLKRNFIAYANFASEIMHEPVIKRQLANAWKILHREITKHDRRIKKIRRAS